MVESTPDVSEAVPLQRADARRNKQTLLDAAAAVFTTSGVEAPIRDIARRAGVGTATIYRHFPTRADLIVAVYRHQVKQLIEAGPALLESGITRFSALAAWIDLFVDFLVTKNGLAAVLQSDDPCYDPLHALFLEQVLPVCQRLVEEAAACGEVRTDITAYEVLRGVGGLCASVTETQPYDARRLVGALLDGLRRSS